MSDNTTNKGSKFVMSYCMYNFKRKLC